MTSRRRRAGFTLLEVLLAVTLLSMITSAILGGLHLGKRAWETGRDYEGVNEVEEAANALAAILARAYPVPVAHGDRDQTVAFQGRANRIRLVATSEGGASWAGLDILEIGVSGPDLVISTDVFRADSWRSADGSRRVKALAGVEAFELAYFGSVEQDAPPRWSNSWVDQHQPPRLVSAKVVALRRGKRIGVSFTIAIRQRPE